MKPLLLILSAFAFVSHDLKASDDASTPCSGNNKLECEAYITGLVEGYIASKQNYLPKPPELDSKYLARAFANRVGNNYTSINNKEAACLPKQVNKEEIIQHLVNTDKPQGLTEQLGNYLRVNYSCTPKQ